MHYGHAGLTVRNTIWLQQLLPDALSGLCSTGIDAMYIHCAAHPRRTVHPRSCTAHPNHMVHPRHCTVRPHRSACTARPCSSQCVLVPHSASLFLAVCPRPRSASSSSQRVLVLAVCPRPRSASSSSQCILVLVARLVPRPCVHPHHRLVPRPYLCATSLCVFCIT